MEDYAAKMARKTDAELLQYLDRRAEYRDEAVLAAFAELERRGHQLPNGAPPRAELEEAARREAAVEAARAPEPAPWARDRAAEEEPEEEVIQGPALYTPGTIAIFSVLFSFFVGGLLLLLNFLRLRRYGGAALLLAVVVGVLGLEAWLASSLGLRPELVAFGTNVVAALLYVYVMWPYFIGPQPYRPRSWLVPMLIAFAISMVMVLLLRMAGISLPSFGS
jgi:hypothetical protein